MITTLTTTALASPVAAAVAEDGRWHGGGGFFLLGPLFALFWIGLIVLAVTFLVRRSGGRGAEGRWGGPWGGSAESVLRERYARGEVDDEEYRARLDILRGSR